MSHGIDLPLDSMAVAAALRCNEQCSGKSFWLTYLQGALLHLAYGDLGADMAHAVEHKILHL